jgi:hypothetical protein
MKKRSYLNPLLMIYLLIISTSPVKPANPVKNSGIVSFDEGWRFLKGNPAGAFPMS